MKSRIVLFIVSLIVWSALSWAVDWQHLVIGVLVSVLVAAAAGDLFVRRPHLLRHPARYFYFLFAYLPLLLWEIVRANLDVAMRVLNPALPIRPGIVKIRSKLRSETGLTFLANSITLTPGTMTVDVDAESGTLYIHWIAVRSTDPEEATKAIAGRFEPLLLKIFEEDVVE
ncbi:Na+/H+ antiporter subunit E [Candidatus Fermentibacterales bacterium]|nr:Na+/H+ antiporter subunit E [Candidatus Fermentibacterales bacterium]